MWQDRKCTRCLEEGHEADECIIKIQACKMCWDEMHHQALCPKYIERLRKAQQMRNDSKDKKRKDSRDPEEVSEEDSYSEDYEGDGDVIEKDMVDELREEGGIYEEDDDSVASDFGGLAVRSLYFSDDDQWSEEGHDYTGVAEQIDDTPASRD